MAKYTRFKIKMLKNTIDSGYTRKQTKTLSLIIVYYYNPLKKMVFGYTFFGLYLTKNRWKYHTRELICKIHVLGWLAIRAGIRVSKIFCKALVFPILNTISKVGQLNSFQKQNFWLVSIMKSLAYIR